MEEITKYKIKAFLWDQFILPVTLFFNVQQIQAIIIGFIFLAIIVYKSVLTTFILLSLLVLLYLYNLYKYYQSGEFMKNYRDYKYPAYRKAIRQIHKEKKQEERDESQEQATSIN